MVSEMASIWIWCSLERNGLCKSVPMRSMASSIKPTTVEASGVNQPEGLHKAHRYDQAEQRDKQPREIHVRVGQWCVGDTLHAALGVGQVHQGGFQPSQANAVQVPGFVFPGQDGRRAGEDIVWQVIGGTVAGEFLSGDKRADFIRHGSPLRWAARQFT